MKKELIKGIGASKGFAQGKVRVINNLQEMNEFLDGEVLVSEYTNPSYVKAMIKAVAIVTDTGGITSHAAIISRELGLPCIVGTKIATRVLKDGDLVEVDADKGVVKILK